MNRTRLADPRRAESQIFSGASGFRVGSWRTASGFGATRNADADGDGATGARNGLDVGAGVPGNAVERPAWGPPRGGARPVTHTKPGSAIFGGRLGSRLGSLPETPSCPPIRPAPIPSPVSRPASGCSTTWFIAVADRGASLSRDRTDLGPDHRPWPGPQAARRVSVHGPGRPDGRLRKERYGC